MSTMAENTTAAAAGVGAETAHHANHVVPARVFLATWLGLVVLTVVTVMVAGYDLGEINFHVAMGVASAKAALVLLFFMHLYWDKPFNAVVLIVSIAFVALLISFTMTDAREYQPDRIPGYAPMIQNK
jgi:cytochrome c oxidase subunit 4